MAKNKPTALEDEHSDLEAIPAWKRQSVERSLQAARARAQDRSDRFVNAGIELIRTTGDTGFTVQEVADQARMSIRTFYLFFATKDDLLLAIHQTILASEVEPRLQRECDSEPDPVTKIQVFINALFTLSGTSGPSTRAFMVQQHRLAETRPDDLYRAMEPQVSLVAKLLRAAAAAGRLRSGLDIEAAARLIHHLTLGIVETRSIGSNETGKLSRNQVWEFCSAAIGAIPSDASPSTRPNRRSK